MHKKTWSPPGWPWELELLALLFVITAIVIPIYLGSMQPVQEQELSLIEQARADKLHRSGADDASAGFFWAVVIVGLYLAHIAMASASLEYISTSFTHLISPLLFSMITYFRLFELTEGSNVTMHVVKGTMPEILLWVIGVLAITFLVARIRMARHMLKFRDVKWQIVTPAKVDSSYFRLMPYITPLLYTPKCYKACSEGLVIEGRMYVMPIPYESIQSLSSVKRSAYTSSGSYLSTLR